MVEIEGGTQALRQTMVVRTAIGGVSESAISVPDPFGALILKAAAHKADSRDRDRHLQDAAVLLACVDPFAPRSPSGSDRARLLHLRRHLADPLHPVWIRLRSHIDTTPRKRSPSSPAARAAGG